MSNQTDSDKTHQMEKISLSTAYLEEEDQASVKSDSLAHLINVLHVFLIHPIWREFQIL